MHNSPFEHREDSIASRLGVDRPWIRDHRHRSDLDRFWTFGPNRAVLWNEVGVTWLAEQLVKKAAPASPDPESRVENPGGPPRAPLALLPEKSGAVTVLEVIRVKFANPRVIQAQTGWGATVTVIGVKPKLWWPGFLLLARENSRGVWEFEGNPQQPDHGRRQPRGRTDPVWPRRTLRGAV